MNKTNAYWLIGGLAAALLIAWGWKNMQCCEAKPAETIKEDELSAASSTQVAATPPTVTAIEPKPTVAVQQDDIITDFVNNMPGGMQAYDFVKS